MYRLLVCLTLSVLLPYAFSQDEEESTQLRSRCFQFTWLGHRYNNVSEYLNATCQDATQLASGVPCFRPLVASFDGSWPDVNYIWRNYQNEATCLLADNDVCATYTYYFNGLAENSTYLCSRAVNTEGQAINSGCYTQTNGSFSTKVCFCKSIAGGLPCNNAVSMAAPLIVVALSVVMMLNKELVDVWWK